jgi:hypothetical protein
MGWRDRDYAKWTDEERRIFYGSAAPSRRRAPRRLATANGLLRPRAGLAALVSGVIAIGLLPFRHQLLPALHVGGRPWSASPPTAPVGQITGLSSATLGSTLSIRGTAPLPDGPVRVEGSYDGGRTWQILSTAQSSGGTYSAQVSMSRRGYLSIKVLYANGTSAVGSILVR